MTDGMQPPADKQTPNREEGSGGPYGADASASQAEVWTRVAKRFRVVGRLKARFTAPNRGGDSEPLLSHVAFGTLVGERQTGERITTQRELWGTDEEEETVCDRSAASH